MVDLEFKCCNYIRLIKSFKNKATILYKTDKSIYWDLGHGHISCPAISKIIYAMSQLIIIFTIVEIKMASIKISSKINKSTKNKAKMH